ncbi:MAG: DUF5320 domain-containing protein [Bacteroidota bacterium]|nr:DUF5320 domain-containing protein [Bacteroidota bacterium]
MPRGDKTGPNAMGSMTGRRMGYCVGNNRPGFANNQGFATGYGRGMRNGFGNGQGNGAGNGAGSSAGRSFGRGFSRGYGQAYDGNFNDFGNPNFQNTPNKEAIENEMKILKNQMSFLEKQLTDIDKDEKE